jgi:hypothetical protein
MNLVILAILCLPILAQSESKASVAGSQETLHYSVNWPSGLSLGEAQLGSSSSDEGWKGTFTLDASLPGYGIVESAKSAASPDLCSIELEKDATRGKRKINETTAFDAGTATRTTKGGGKSELQISSCAKDALAFIAHLRKELAAGRLPAQQKVYYGAPYDVRVTYKGSQTIAIAGAAVETDRLVAAIKGPASNIEVELFFSRDAVRTPVLIRAPLAMGSFSMELMRD